MKKKPILLIMLVLMVWLTPTAFAQTPPVVSSLIVELWPDYDRASVLVLITGTVAGAPSDLTIPLPANADLNVVARVTSDGNMIDDIVVDSSVPGQISFTSPEQVFRVEYYVPYELSGTERSFTFEWTAPFDVTKMDVAVQQPTGTAVMTLEPAAENFGISDSDGFTYYVMPSQAVAAGETYTLTISYDNPTGQLSIDNLPTPVNSGSNTAADTAVAPAPAPAATSTSFDWAANLPWILGGAGLLLIIAGLVWQFTSNRAQSSPSSEPKRPAKRKSTKTKTTTASAKPKKKAARFCHECGASLGPHDKFCRECGTAVKHAD
jgi:ribosomal protein L40E